MPLRKPYIKRHPTLPALHHRGLEHGNTHNGCPEAGENHLNGGADKGFATFCQQANGNYRKIICHIRINDEICNSYCRVHNE